MCYDSTVICGYLGQDPEMRYTGDAKAVCEFNVAVDRGYGENKNTIWYSVVVWEKQAESCNQYLSKGSLVLCDGTVKAEAWIDKKTGEAKCKLKLTAFKVKFLNKVDKADAIDGGDFPF